MTNYYSYSCMAFSKIKAYNLESQPEIDCLRCDEDDHQYLTFSFPLISASSPDHHEDQPLTQQTRIDLEVSALVFPGLTRPTLARRCLMDVLLTRSCANLLPSPESGVRGYASLGSLACVRSCAIISHFPLM